MIVTVFQCLSLLKSRKEDSFVQRLTNANR